MALDSDGGDLMGYAIIVGRVGGKNGWKHAWRMRCSTRAGARSRRWLKKRAHRAARRGDGIVRLNPRTVI